MGEELGKVTASVIKNGDETLSVILHSLFFDQMRVRNAGTYSSSYGYELNVLLEPEPTMMDSFADQVVKEVEELEQLALVI